MLLALTLLAFNAALMPLMEEFIPMGSARYLLLMVTQMWLPGKMSFKRGTIRKTKK
jgi:hypothetical protein